jgi:hypothetical protein
MGLSVAALRRELEECGYDGERMSRKIAWEYDAFKRGFVYQTGAKTADKQVLMLSLEIGFLPGREFEIWSLSACLLKERLEQFGVPLGQQRDIWQQFDGLPTIETVVNALSGRVQEVNTIHQLNNQNLTTMNLNNLERLQEELKTLGFSKQTSEAMQQQMEKGVSDFRLHEKVMGDKGQVDLTLYFKQSSQSEHYYFNKFEAALNTGKPLDEGQKYMVITPNEKEPGKNLVKPFENVTEAVEFFKEQKGNNVLAAGKDAANKVELAKMEKGKVNYIAKDFQRTYNTPAVTQTFFVQNGKGFTAEQSANLIQNRAVFRDDLLKTSGDPYSAWVKLDRDKPKDQYQNFQLVQWSVPNYGFILKDTLEKFNIKELNEPAKSEAMIRSLENGNRPLVTVMKDGQETKLYLETAPRYSQLNFFREDGKTELREQFLKEPAIGQKVELAKGAGKEKDQEKELAPGR